MKKHINHIYTLIFGVIVFVYFLFFYSYHFYYQEQFQLFLFTGNYFAETVLRPGGFSDYVAAFLTQFFLFPWIGALTLTLLLIILQMLIAFVSNKMKRQPKLYPLTFVPSILYWGFLCDENTMLSGLIALIFTVGAAALYAKILNKWWRLAVLIVGSILLYTLCGGVYVLFPTLCILLEIFYFKDFKIKTPRCIISIFASALILIFLPRVAAIFFQFPLERLYWGLNYYRFPTMQYSSLLYIWLPVIIVPLAFALIPKNEKKSVALLLLQTFAIAVLAFLAVRGNSDFVKEEIMAYDFNVRAQRWDKIILMAEKKSPNAPMSVAALNLALCKQGQLGDRMFSFYQNGVEGLLPTFKRDFTLPLLVGEIYYHLGFVNTAQRFAFEAMEAIPNYTKSARVIKRLAETNLINGEYNVARKYLRLLQKTLFYKNFANRTLSLLGNEAAINAHPEYGWLRLCRPEKDFLFSGGEKDMMLGQLFTHNRKNRMAFEYLMAYCLLRNDLQAFAKYFPLGKSIGYTRIPKTYQDAIYKIQQNIKTAPVPQKPEENAMATHGE